MTTRNQYKLKVAAAFGLSMILTFLMISRASAGHSPDDPYRVEEFSIRAPGSLEVHTSGGHITVEGSKTDRIRVEMYALKKGEELSPSDTDLQDFDITIEQSGNRVTAVARRRNGSGSRNISISFVVYTPREMTTDLRTSGGHIKAVNLEGEQRLSTSGGHLEMSRLKGLVNARTSGGHIEIRDFSGQLDARTSGGHIDAVRSDGTVELRTNGGHISLDQVSGSVRASTSGGSIEADITGIDPAKPGINLRTSGGHINVMVPEGIGLDLDLKGTFVTSKLNNFSGRVERNEVLGQMNGGGPKVAAHTSGGTVRVGFH